MRLRVVVQLAVAAFLLSRSARADQCALLPPAQAKAAAKELSVGSRFVEWCEPCATDGGGKKVVEVKSLEIRDASDGTSKLLVNGEQIDLAYAFVEEQSGRYLNLARKVGCPTTGVSASWQSADKVPPGRSDKAPRLEQRQLEGLVSRIETDPEGDWTYCVVTTASGEDHWIVPGENGHSNCRSFLGQAVKITYHPEQVGSTNGRGDHSVDWADDVSSAPGSIQANGSWQPTGIDARADTAITLVAVGSWAVSPRYPLFGADGVADSGLLDYRAYKTAKLGALVCGVQGSNNVYAGSTIEFVADRDGPVKCRINDTDLANNRGAVWVRRK